MENLQNSNSELMKYDEFKLIFMKLLNIHSPMKKDNLGQKCKIYEQKINKIIYT